VSEVNALALPDAQPTGSTKKQNRLFQLVSEHGSIIGFKCFQQVIEVNFV